MKFDSEKKYSDYFFTGVYNLYKVTHVSFSEM